jgi:hypothetical protein
MPGWGRTRRGARTHGGRAALIALLPGLALVLALAGCGRARTGSFPVQGTLRLLNSGDGGYLAAAGGSCAGSGTFADITNGAVITVSAGSDDVATGSLKDATWISATECDWTISVKEVPAGKVRYTVAVGTGSSHTFSEGDLRGDPVMTIGG